MNSEPSRSEPSLLSTKLKESHHLNPYGHHTCVRDKTINHLVGTRFSLVDSSGH